MFSALASSPRVRSSSITNTQGLPANRLTYIAFAELQHACPLTQRYHVGRRHMNPFIDSPYTAYIGLDWADTKHDVCLQAAGCEHREFTSLPHQVGEIETWARALAMSDLPASDLCGMGRANGQ